MNNKEFKKKSELFQLRCLIRKKIIDEGYLENNYALDLYKKANEGVSLWEEFDQERDAIINELNDQKEYLKGLEDRIQHNLERKDLLELYMKKTYQGE